MGFIAGFLLMTADSKAEDETFFMFCRVMVSYRASLLYVETLPLYSLHAYQFQVLLQKMFPDIYAHLEKEDVTPEMYVTKWIMCLFTRDMPFSSSARVWDLIICDGTQSVVALALAIIKLLRSRLLEESVENIIDLLTFATEMPPPDKVVRVALSFRLHGQLAKLRADWEEAYPKLAKELQERTVELATKCDDPIEVPPVVRGSPRTGEASARMPSNLKASPTPSSACPPEDAVAKAVNTSVPASPFSTALEADGRNQAMPPQPSERSSAVFHAEVGADALKSSSEEPADGEEASSSKGLSPRASVVSSSVQGSVEVASFTTSGRLCHHSSTGSRTAAGQRRKQAAGMPQTAALAAGEIVDSGDMASVAPPLNLRNLSRPESLCSSARRSDAKGVLQRDSSPPSPGDSRHLHEPGSPGRRHKSDGTQSTGSKGKSRAAVSGAAASGGDGPSPSGAAGGLLSPLTDSRITARQLLSRSLPAEGAAQMESSLPPIHPQGAHAHAQGARARLPVREPAPDRQQLGGATRVVRSLSPGRRSGKQELPPLQLHRAAKRASSGERERRGSTSDGSVGSHGRLGRGGSGTELPLHSGGSTPLAGLGGSASLSRQLQPLPPQFPRMPLQPLCRSAGHDSVPNSPPASARLPAKHQRVLSAATCPELDDGSHANDADACLYGNHGDDDDDGEEYPDNADQQTYLASTRPSFGECSHTPGSNWSQDTQGQASAKRSASRVGLTKQGSRSSNFAPLSLPASHANAGVMQDPPLDVVASPMRMTGYKDEAMRVAGMAPPADPSPQWGNARKAASPQVTDSPEAPNVPAPTDREPNPQAQVQQAQPSQGAGEGSPMENRKRSAWGSPSEVAAVPGGDDEAM